MSAQALWKSLKGRPKVMSKINYEKTKYASFAPQRMKALSNKKKAIEPATEKQKVLMDKLGIQYPKAIYKLDAMKLISVKLGK
jgi:hypothetical protein